MVTTLTALLFQAIFVLNSLVKQFEHVSFQYIVTLTGYVQGLRYVYQVAAWTWKKGLCLGGSFLRRNGSPSPPKDGVEQL